MELRREITEPVHKLAELMDSHLWAALGLASVLDNVVGILGTKDEYNRASLAVEGPPNAAEMMIECGLLLPAETRRMWALQKPFIVSMEVE